MSQIADIKTAKATAYSPLLSGISYRDRLILLNAALTEVLQQVREAED